MDGSVKIKIAQQDIIEYLRSIEHCPFCESQNLVEKKVFNSREIWCDDCGFSLSSHNLYMRSEVKEGMKTVEDVLFELIQKAVKRHQKKIENRLVNLTLYLERTKEVLLLRRNRFIRREA